jgi:hypothetical protein
VHLSRLLRAAPFRLALIYAGLFSLSVLALVMVLYFATTRLVENQLRTTVMTELQALQSELDGEGSAELARALASRAADPAAQGFAYLLQDSAGRHVAGDDRGERHAGSAHAACAAGGYWRDACRSGANASA